MKEHSLSLTSFQLKVIAMVSMFIDHFGSIWRPYLSKSTYYLCRGLGRMAFPLFAFTLVEGFFYTKKREKHLILLFLFALLSELPFDICLKRSLLDQIPGPFDRNHQNIFFTLFIGYLMMMFLNIYVNETHHIAIFILACTISEVLGTDYGALGIVTILLFYYRRYQPNLQAQSTWLLIPLIPLSLYSLKFRIQFACILALLPLSLYQGEKGRSLKYMFYVFYPLHLILLYGLRHYLMS